MPDLLRLGIDAAERIGKGRSGGLDAGRLGLVTLLFEFRLRLRDLVLETLHLSAEVSWRHHRALDRVHRIQVGDAFNAFAQALNRVDTWNMQKLVHEATGAIGSTIERLAEHVADVS